MKNPSITAGIYIGTTKETLSEAQKAVMAILKSGQEQATIQKALDVYQNICAVNNVSVTNCTVNTPSK